MNFDDYDRDLESQDFEDYGDSDRDLDAERDDDDGPVAGDFGDGDDDRTMFAEPGGNSALRAATSSNPRNCPCPTCHAPNRLTPKDVELGYQCNTCADSAEGRGP